MSDDRIMKVLKELGHIRWTVFILAGMIIGMAYATYLESVIDHKAALDKGFHALPMDILIAMLAVNLSACTVHRAPYHPHQYPWLITHVGILLIMAGAIISHRTAMEGNIVLRAGQTATQVRLFTETATPVFSPLGYELELDSFRVEYYPGTQKAADYVSFLRMFDPESGERDTLIVRVNHPLVKNGWNVSQSSFFPGDDRATILGANRDPGTWFSYSGFITVFVGLLGLFFLKPWLKKQFPPPKTPQTAKAAIAELKEVEATVNE